MIISLWVGGCISQIHKTSVKIVTSSLFSNSVVKKLQKIQWYDLRPTFYQSIFVLQKVEPRKGWAFLFIFLFLGMKILSDWFLGILWNWIGQLLMQLGGRNLVVKSRWPFLRCASTASCWGARHWQFGWKKLWDVSNCWSLNNVGSLSVEKCQ